MKYGSVCSGIEAATVAWHPLGWTPAWFAEIEPFPSRVLAHHYPGVPNLGDMTTIAARILAGEVERPALLVGGTPCQSFSVAGLRKGLADARGNLALSFAELVDVIDPAVTLWENVPGVLSDKTNAFGCLLGALVGAGAALEPHRDLGWTDAGVVAGPRRVAAWRVLDAQFFGLAQRRRRVFVVVCPRDGADPAEILFESPRLRWDPPTRGEAGQGVAGALAASTGGSDENDAKDGRLVPAYAPAVSPALMARDFKGPSSDGDGAPLIAHSLRGEGFDASEDGTGRGTPLVACAQLVSGNQGAMAIQEDNQNGVTVRDTAGSLRADAPGTQPCGSLVMEPPTAFHLTQDPISETGGGTPAMSAGNRQGCATLGVMTGGGFDAASVRRLTPRECERLMGLPDDYTAIPGAADGPRYRSLGNSIAINVLAWIGRRIDARRKP